MWKFGGSAPNSATFAGEPMRKILAVNGPSAPSGADHVPYVGAHPEFRHATDVDGYFHEWNLTTEGTAYTGNSPNSVIPSGARDPTPGTHSRASRGPSLRSG